MGDPPTDLNAFRNALKTGCLSERGRPPSDLNAFRNAVKTALDSLHCTPPPTHLNAFRIALKTPKAAQSARHYSGRHVTSDP